jgi:L-amino acid N-acyltransferase YncA
MKIMIASMTAEHYSDVKNIYEQGISSGHATFETTSPPWTDWDAGHLKHSRFVAMVDDKVVGWAALSPVSRRPVYSGVAEVSVYVEAEFRRKSIGRVLLQALIGESESNGIWTLQAGIFPENNSSIRLHESHGFRKVGFREKIGKMNGSWRDTFQFERRSQVVGT